MKSQAGDIWRELPDNLKVNCSVTWGLPIGYDEIFEVYDAILHCHRSITSAEAKHYFWYDDEGGMPCLLGTTAKQAKKVLNDALENGEIK